MSRRRDPGGSPRYAAAILVACALLAGCGEPTAPPTSDTFTAVVTGDDHTCAIDANGRTYCWGDGRLGQIGALIAPREAPCDREICSRPVPLADDLAFTDLALGEAHSCAIASGTTYCWGFGRFGQLGDAGLITGICAHFEPFRCATLPERVVAGVAFADVAAARMHTCGVARTGRTYCWGNNLGGQLGTGDKEPREYPVLVETGQRFESITTGVGHTCALTAEGRAYCWGSGAAGRLGTGHVHDFLLPYPVASDEAWIDLDAGDGHTCGVAVGGAVFCWGLGAQGQLGLGDRASRTRPTRVALPEPASAVSGGAAHTCAVGASGALYCWGGNGENQLGDVTTELRLTPVVIDVPETVARVSA